MKASVSTISLVLALVFLTLPAHGAVLLQNLDGAASLTVLSPDGTKREVKAGEPLQTGDILATGEHVALTVAFEQGTQVMVSTDSKVQVSEESEEPGEPKVPSVVVREGDVRALVEAYQTASPPSEADAGTPASTPSNASGVAPAPKSHRFMIRTTTAVMGVRGTDFLVSAKDDRFSLNTVSGTVEFADDIKGFKSPAMVSVGAGHVLTADGAKPFEVEAFLKDFNQKHPQVEKLYIKAKQDISSGTLAQKFALARAQGSDATQLKGNGLGEITFPGKKKKTMPSPKPGRPAAAK
jgi:hypothetical protein